MSGKRLDESRQVLAHGHVELHDIQPDLVEVVDHAVVVGRAGAGLVPILRTPQHREIPAA